MSISMTSTQVTHMSIHTEPVWFLNYVDFNKREGTLGAFTCWFKKRFHNKKCYMGYINASFYFFFFFCIALYKVPLKLVEKYINIYVCMYINYIYIGIL